MRGHGALWLSGLLVTAWAGAARADPQPKPRVAIRAFDGPGAARVRAAVVKAFTASRRFELVPSSRVEETTAERSADPNSAEGRALVAAELALDGLVDGRLSRRGRSFELVLQVYSGESLEPTVERTYRARRTPALAALVRRRLLAELRRSRQPLSIQVRRAPGASVQDEPSARESEASPEAESVAVQESVPEAGVEAEPMPAAEPEAESAASAALTAIEFALHVRVLTRDYAYRDATANLPEHSWRPTPAIRLQTRWYPAAHFTDGLAAFLGVELHAQLMLPIEARQGVSIHSTESRVFGGGLRLRIPLAPSEVALHAGLGAHDVVIGDSQFGGDPGVPSAAYRFARFGADARIALSSTLRLELRASYLVMTAFGEIADVRWFPHTTGGGVEAELGASYALAPPLWLEAGVHAVRYDLTFNSRPDDPSVVVRRRIAAGAADLQLGGVLGLALRW
jgi:hypothetical protein